jgi:hypothetical protein
MKTDTEHAMEEAIRQFKQRLETSKVHHKIENAALLAGSDMYFYCQHCGVFIEQLPEAYLFPPRRECSQCEGLIKVGWMEEAKK